MRVCRTTVFTVGLAVTLALMVGIATTALAAAPGSPFRLGKTNKINRLSSLVGTTAGFMLKVDNNGAGPALDLQVGPSTTPPDAKTVAPMKVDSQVQVVNLNADELDGKDSTDFAAYERTVIVSPVPGDAAASGTKLLDALSGITDASQENPYLLKIEPGVYDLGSSPLVMKQWVDIEGSGEGVTTIRRAGSPNFDTGTVVAANKAELRFVTVENTGGATRATAIWNEGASSLRLLNVTARASGGSVNVGVDTLNASPEMTDLTVTAAGGGGTDNYGLFNNGASPTVTNVTATASGGNLSQGVHNRNSSSPMMTDVTVTASNASNGNAGVWNETSSSPEITGGRITVLGTATSFNRGVFNQNSSPRMTGITVEASGGSITTGIANVGSSPTMTNVTARASGGSTSNHGVSSTFSSSPTMNDVTAVASGGDFSIGVLNDNSSPVIRDSTLEASGGNLINRALTGDNGGTIRIDNSRLSATGGEPIVNTGSTSARVGASRLDGGSVSGTVTCAGVYDENYAFFASTCP